MGPCVKTYDHHHFCRLQGFDSIDRCVIPIVLSKYGVVELLIANVTQFYIGTSAVEATAHGNIEEFSTKSGVLQGDTLAPFLFITILDYVLRRSEWMFPLRGRISYRHCRQPKLPNVLFSSSTTSGRLIRRANNNNVLRKTLLNNIDGITITPRRSSHYPAVRIGALVNADDIAITCDTIDQVENVLRRLEMSA